MTTATLIPPRPALPPPPARPRRAPGIRLIRAAGCCATAALAVLTAGAPFPPPVVVAASLVAMGTVALAWLALSRHLATITSRHLYGVAVAWSLPLMVARPLFSGDVWNYLAQGLTAAIGLDPYRLGPAQALGVDSPVTQHVSHYWVNTPAPYGPAWLAMSRAVALMTGERLTIGVLLYRLIALAGIVLIAWALPRLARRVDTPPTTALWLGLLNPLVLWHLVAGVHNDAIMLGLMLTGIELALAGLDHGRETARTQLVAGVTLLTVAANIKIVAATAVCCLAAEVARRHSHPARPVITLLSGVAAGTVVLSLVSGFGWISALRTPVTVYSWMAPTTAIGLLIGGLATLQGAHITATAVTIANLVGAGICAAVAVRLLIAVLRGRLHPLRGLGLIFTAVLLCGPVVQPWYLLWAMLPLAATARTRRDRAAVAGVSVAIALALPPITTDASALFSGYLIAATVFGGAVVLRRAHRNPAGPKHPCPRAMAVHLPVEVDRPS